MYSLGELEGLNMFGFYLDLGFNFDENVIFFDHQSKETATTSNNSDYHQSKPFPDLTSPKTMVSDSLPLCKTCFNPLSVYFLSLERAIKLCTNTNCQQYLDNTFDMSSCLFECNNLDECIKKYGRPSESQSKQMEEILGKYIQVTELRLDLAISKQESLSKTSTTEETPIQPEVNQSTLESQLSTDALLFEDLLTMPFSPSDNTQQQQQPIDFDLDFNYNPSNQTFDLTAEVDASQLDNVLSTFDQSATTTTTTTTIAAPIGFRTQLEELTTATTNLVELKPVNSSTLAARMATQVLDEQFLSCDEVVVAHAKQNASSIKIVRSANRNRRTAAPSNNIFNTDEVDSSEKKAAVTTTTKTQPQPQTVKIISKQAAASSQQSSSLLLPWEIKNKPLKRKLRQEVDEDTVESKVVKSSESPSKLNSPLNNATLSRTALDDKASLVKEKGSLIKNALFTDKSILTSFSSQKTTSSIKSNTSYKDLVLNVLKKKPTNV